MARPQVHTQHPRYAIYKSCTIIALQGMWRERTLTITELRFSLVPQRHDGINLRGSPRRHIAGGQRHAH
jgi:hypothetical protein